MHPSIFLSSLLFIPSISANCTTWSHGRSQSDNDRSFSTTYAIPVDNISCPASSSGDCSIPRKTYSIDVHRQLNISASKADIDGIFALAQANYGPDNYSPSAFIDLNGTVSTWKVGDIILDTKNGTNKTLYWTPFMRYSFGTLGNCTNETLNGVGVTAVASYFKTNTSELAGNWIAFADNNTIPSGAGRFGVGGLEGLAVTLGLMFVLVCGL